MRRLLILLIFFIYSYQVIVMPISIYIYPALVKSQFLYYFCLIILLFLLYSTVMKQIIKDRVLIEVYFYFFILAVLISTFVSSDTLFTLYGEDQRYEGLATWLCYLTLFFVSYLTVQSTSIKPMFNIFIVITLFVSFYGILQHFHLDFFPRYFERVNQTRSYAFFDNPNFFGSYLVLVLSITLMLYFISKNKQSLLFLVIASTHFIALLYSQTRSAWLGLLVSLLLFGAYFLIKKRKYLKRYIIVGVTFVILFLVVNVTESGIMFGRFSSILEDANSAFLEEDLNAGSSRMYIWKKSLPLIKEYFWFGSGPDTFAKVFPYDAEEYEQYFGTSNIIVDKAHNEYLQIAITMGVPALIAYLSLVFVILRKAFRALRIASDAEFIMMLGFTAAIVGYLVQAFFNISVVTVAPYYWIFLGITYRLAENILERKESSTSYVTGKRQYLA